MYGSPSRVQFFGCCQKPASHTFKRGDAYGIVLFTQCFICKYIACNKHIISVYRYIHILVYICNSCICKRISVPFSLNRQPPGNIMLHISANIYYLNNISHLEYSDAICFIIQ